MAENTAIGWTDHTFNPWWGCTHVSPGCLHCYAEAFAKRTGHGVWGDDAPRRMLSDNAWRKPHKWDRDAELAGRPALVFCASMADVFEDRPELEEPRLRLFDTITNTPHLIWQLLTKRPENVLRLVEGWVIDAGHPRDWPSNVWIGTTVENTAMARRRIPQLLDIPAQVRFLSVEPQLELVDLWDAVSVGANHVEWVIQGGESGPGHRPFDIEWARLTRDQCAATGVPYFFKQIGGPRPGAPGPNDLETCKAFPAAAGDRTSTPVEIR